MKVLFVCQRNNGRSQMAASIYNKLSGSDNADSAGTEVDNDGQRLIDRAREPGSEVGRVIEVMGELGIDVSNNHRTLLKPEVLDNYDKVIAIMKPETVPDYLRNNPTTEVWAIEDPKVKDTEGVRETRDVIQTKVSEILDQ